MQFLNRTMLTGTNYLSVDGKSLEGVAVDVWPDNTATLSGWDVNAKQWHMSSKLPMQPANFIGLEFSSSAVTLRLDKQSASLKFSTSISAPSAFNKIDLYAQGSGFITGGTSINFDNICADPLPTPVVSTGTVTLASPADGATGQSVTPTLSWSATGSPTAYRIFAATDENTLKNLSTDATTCSGCVVTANTGTTTSYTFATGALQASTKYYWRVKAGYSGGNVLSDSTWSFTTAGSGGGGGSSCTATIDQALKLNIPVIKYTDQLLGNIYLWADMDYVLNPSKVLFKLKDYGMIQNVSGYTCTMSTIDSDLTIHVNELLYGGTSYWLKLAFDTSLSSGNNLYFKAADYGTGTGGGGGTGGGSGGTGTGGSGGQTFTIGQNGGTVQTGDLKIEIPSGTFSSSTNITATKASIPDEYKEEDIVSNAYEVKIDSVALNKDISVSITKAKDASGTVLAYILQEGYSISGGGATNVLTPIVAKIEGDKLVVQIPARTGSAAGSQSAYFERNASSAPQYTFTIWFIAGYGAYDTAHFRTYYRHDGCNFMIVKEYAQYAEDAYTGLEALGLKFHDLYDQWPITIDVVPLPTGEKIVYGEAVTIPGYPFYINLNNDSCNDRNKNTTMKVTIGHEFFHLIQSLFDPQWVQMGNYDDFYWLKEASSVWFEAEMMGNEGYQSSAFLDNNKFYLNGLEAGGKSAPASHGYGASGFLRYLTSKYGKTLISKIWNEVKSIDNSAYYNSTFAIQSSTSGLLSSDWKDFIEKFLTGNTGYAGWSTPGSDETFVYQVNIESKEFSKDIKSLSAVKYYLNFLDLKETKDFKIELTEGKSDNIKLLLFDGKTKTAEFDDSYNLKASANDRYHLIVINTDELFPYNSSIQIKVKIIASGPTFTVTASAGTGGTISPSSKTVNSGSTASFTVTPDTGYSIESVTGCGGTLAGNTYTTGPITAICTVSATFRSNDSGNGSTYTSTTGKADGELYVWVTIGNVVNFKTVDDNGWGRKGATFEAETTGSGVVPITIGIGATDWSYYDYIVSVLIKNTSSNVEYLKRSDTIPKAGGSKSYSYTWGVGANPGNLKVEVSIWGGNPGGFIRYVNGVIKEP